MVEVPVGDVLLASSSEPNNVTHTLVLDESSVNVLYDMLPNLLERTLKSQNTPFTKLVQRGGMEDKTPPSQYY